MFEKRYHRNFSFLNKEEQERLSSSHAAIVGAGGLGGVVFEILLRAGVGNISIADNDSFDETNLNRQLLSAENLLGTPKVSAAKTRCAHINSSCRVVAIKEKINSSNAALLLSGAELLIDCTDSIKGRFEIELAASKLSIPLVHAAVAGAVGQIATILPNENIMEKIYGPKDIAPEKGDELTLGAPAQAVFSIASMQAFEALNILAGKGPTLHKKLLRVNLNDWKFTQFNI